MLGKGSLHMGEVLVFEDKARLEFLLRTPINEQGAHFWDPQCEEPLDENVEKSMDQMGPRIYISWLCQEYGVGLDPIPENPHLARRVARQLVRNLKDFTGERYHQ